MSIRKRLVLIIDDYHWASCDENNWIINEIIGSVSDNVTMVVSGRTKPDLPLAYFKCQGRLTIIDMPMLKFSEKESQEILQGAGTSATVKEVISRSSGWPMALQLARLWLREVNEHNRKAFGLDVDRAGINDFLSSEIFKSLPKGLADVLVETSILNQINGDIANFIMERNDCWELLDGLSSLDALITPVTDEGQWFRCHQLFRDFLHGELARRGETHINQLHLRACTWFEKHGAIESAVEQARAAKDTDRITEIIERAGAVRLGLIQGVAVLRRLLNNLELVEMYDRPRLHLAQIWLFAKQGEIKVARDHYDQCISRIEQPTLERYKAYTDVQKEALFVGMMLAEVYEDEDFARADIDQIETMAASSETIDHWFQGWVNNLLCIVYTRKGRFQTATTVAEAAHFHYKQTNSEYGQAFMLLHLAIVKLLDGHLQDAKRAITEASEFVTSHCRNDAGLLGIIQLIKGAILLENDSLDEASESVLPAIEGVQLSEGWVDIYILGYQAGIELSYRHDGVSAAFEYVEHARLLAKKRGLPRLMQNVFSAGVEVLTLEGRLDQASELIKAEKLELMDTPGLGKDDWREQVHILMIVSRLDIYRGKSEIVATRLQQYIESAEHYGRRRAVVELSIMMALACFDMENQNATASALRKALTIAVPEELRRVFVREGRPMARMLESVVHHMGVSSMTKDTVSFLGDIITRLKRPNSVSEHAENSAILSEREIEILEELAKGSANKVT